MERFSVSGCMEQHFLPSGNGSWIRYADHESVMNRARTLLQQCYDSMEADGWGGEAEDGYNLRVEVKAFLRGKL